jgi:hypothetical protein
MAWQRHDAPSSAGGPAPVASHGTEHQAIAAADIFQDLLVFASSYRLMTYPNVLPLRPNLRGNGHWNGAGLPRRRCPGNDLKISPPARHGDAQQVRR